MNSLVIGAGEVGESLAQVLECDIIDRDEELDEEYDIIHICFPYSEEFKSEVKRYQKIYKPKYTIVHSTVPIGTCAKLDVFHSPIRGMHPKLAESLTTFTTYLAPGNDEIKYYFEEKGMKVVSVGKSEETEALKLFDTTYYFWNIMYEKKVHQFCEDNDLDFDVIYKHANETYNEGYKQMGKLHVRRPILKHMEGPVGGHCLVPNAKILSEEHNFKIAKLLLNMNEVL